MVTVLTAAVCVSVLTCYCKRLLHKVTMVTVLTAAVCVSVLTCYCKRLLHKVSYGYSTHSSCVCLCPNTLL